MQKKTDAYKVDKITPGPGGSLIIDARPTRVGVFDYGEYMQLRPEEEVFDADSMKSLEGCTFTVNHPDADEITPDNYSKYAAGHVLDGSVERDGDYLKAKIMVNDRLAIELINTSSMLELSCGYLCEEFPESGEYNGIKYDSIQRNIVYNHLSLVEEGRAGPACKLITDNKDDMANKKTDEIKAVKPGAEPGLKQIEEAPEATPEIKNDEADKLREQIKELQSKLDTSLSVQDINEIVKRKIRLIDSIKKLISDADEEKLMDEDEMELKKKAIQKNLADFSLEEKSDEYINGVFDALLASKPDEELEEEEVVDEEGAEEEKTDSANTDTRTDTRSFKKVNSDIVDSLAENANQKYQKALAAYENRLAGLALTKNKG